jgi:hypothetical protein
MSQAEHEQLLHDLSAPEGNHITPLISQAEQEELLRDHSAK